MQRSLIALCAAAAVLSAAVPAQAQSTAAAGSTEAQLAQRLDQLAAELAAVKAQLQQLQQQRAGGSTPAAAAAAAPAAAATPVSAAPAATAAAAPTTPAAEGPATVLTSYGEINLNRPTHRSEDTQADLRRFVLGLQHRFNDRTKFVGEVEVEHAVSSADDVGEVAIEQAWVEHQLTPQWAGRAGLQLMPMGLLNENHEPTAYYGVERNFVETAIIPSTWREGAVQAIGTFDNGLTVQFGAGTGFDLGKWDYSAESEARESPLGSIHQEMAQARARDIALFGAVNWRGVPGLHLGAGLFSGGASQGQAGTPKSRVTLWDVHARWTPGRWDLAAVYARGSISHTAALNTLQVGNPTLIPSRFDGWYTQAAYTLWTSGDYALKPFVRWEQFNTARRFEDLGAGLTPEALPTERVITAGANFQLTPEVVLKADWQRFRRDRDADRVNLGLGWSF
jgi:hypothetical protein